MKDVTLYTPPNFGPYMNIQGFAFPAENGRITIPEAHADVAKSHGCRATPFDDAEEAKSEVAESVAAPAKKAKKKKKLKTRE